MSNLGYIPFAKLAIGDRFLAVNSDGLTWCAFMKIGNALSSVQPSIGTDPFKRQAANAVALMPAKYCGISERGPFDIVRGQVMACSANEAVLKIHDPQENFNVEVQA